MGGPRMAIRAWVGRAVLRLSRWRVEGRLPDLPKYLIVVAPHTCYWDLPVGMMAAWSLRLPTAWLGTANVFRWPLGPLLRRLGGIPVNRGRREGIVGQAVAAFAAAESLILAITPEGTRFRVPHWRSGFYRAALAAGVPVMPASFDGPSRCIRLGLPVPLSGEVSRDMDALRRFFAGARGFHPERVGPVRLREEAPLDGEG